MSMLFQLGTSLPKMVSLTNTVRKDVDGRDDVDRERSDGVKRENECAVGHDVLRIFEDTPVSIFLLIIDKVAKDQLVNKRTKNDGGKCEDHPSSDSFAALFVKVDADEDVHGSFRRHTSIEPVVDEQRRAK